MYVYLITAIIGLGGALFGYDIGIISGVLAFDSFKNEFGIKDWHHHLLEQGFIISSFVVGNMIGAGVFASWFADTFGRKRTLVGSCLWFVASSSLQIFATSLPTLYAGRFLCGIAIGVLTMVVPLFNSELAPKEIRGRLISFNQIAMTGGIAIAFWTGYALQNIDNGWRYALAGQTIPALVILLASPVLPESPRWLVKMERNEEATASLHVLRGSTSLLDLKQRETTQRELNEMIETIAQEKTDQSDTWTYMWTNKTSRKRLVTICVLQIGQQLTGINVIMYYMPFIAQSVGFGGTDHGLLANGINGIVNFLSTFIAFFFVDKMGRRLGLIIGGLFMFLGMAVLGSLGMMYAVINGQDVTIDNRMAGWMCIISIYIYVFGFSFSWGPVCWLYPTEVLPTSQRAKGVSLTTFCNFAFNFLIAQFTPVLREDLKFGLFIMFAVLNVCLILFVYFYIPESKGRSLEEMGKAFGDGDDDGDDLQRNLLAKA